MKALMFLSAHLTKVILRLESKAETTPDSIQSTSVLYVGYSVALS